MTAVKPRRHRWVRTGFGTWRCTRRGCGLHRKATDKSSDGYAYRRVRKGYPVGLWVERQLFPLGLPRCV